MSWRHDELLGDLAGHLRATRDRMVWEDMQMGPSGSKRPDIYTVPKSYTQFRPISYEIKISVADFRRDVTAGKWHAYLAFSSGVIFATPAGMISKDDIPPGCGLMVRGDAGWRTVKAPTLKAIETLPRDAWIKLIIDGIERQRNTEAPRPFNEWRAEKELAKKFGEKVASMIASLSLGEERLAAELKRTREMHDAMLRAENERYTEQRKRQQQDRAQVDAELAMLAEALGVDPDVYAVASALREARRSLSRDAEVARLRLVVDRVRNLVGRSAEDGEVYAAH